MELDLGTGRSIKNPTAADIQAAVAELHEDDYLLLQRDTRSFMQTVVGEVEYSEGSIFCRHKMPEYDRRLVSDLLWSYVQDNDAWRRLVPWQDVSDELRKSRRVANAIVLTLIVVIIAFLGFILI